MHYEITPLFSTPLLKTHLGPLDPMTLAWMKNLECPSSAVAQYGNEDHLPETERGFDVLNHPKFNNLQVLIKRAVDYFVHTVLDVVDDTEFVLTTSWINKMNEGSDIGLHNHANALLSGVYYPDLGPTANPITFRKNRQHLNSFPEHENTFKVIGTRRPNKESIPKEKAISVAVGIAQPTKFAGL